MASTISADAQAVHNKLVAALSAADTALKDGDYGLARASIQEADGIAATLETATSILAKEKSE